MDNLEDMSINDRSIINRRNLIVETEKCCSSYLEQIDDVLQTLSTISTSYFDITSRTNLFMRSCEDLLEQQV